MMAKAMLPPPMKVRRVDERVDEGIFGGSEKELSEYRKFPF